MKITTIAINDRSLADAAHEAVARLRPELEYRVVDGGVNAVYACDEALARELFAAIFSEEGSS